MSIITFLTYLTYHQFQFYNHCYTYNQLNTLCGMLCSQRINNIHTIPAGINANNGDLSYDLQNMHMYTVP